MRISNDIRYPVLEMCKKVLETPIGDNMYIIPYFFCKKNFSKNLKKPNHCINLLRKNYNKSYLNL